MKALLLFGRFFDRHADAARVHRALSTVLEEDSQLRDALIENLGFSMKELRPSGDNSKVFILWSTYFEDTNYVEKELLKHVPRLRFLLAKALKAKTVPRLEFRRDVLPEEFERLNAVLDEIDEELRILDSNK